MGITSISFTTNATTQPKRQQQQSLVSLPNLVSIQEDSSLLLSSLSRRFSTMSSNNNIDNNNNTTNHNYKAKKNQSIKDALSSKDWMTDYQTTHVHVDPAVVFGKFMSPSTATPNTQSTPPTTKNHHHHHRHPHHAKRILLSPLQSSEVTKPFSSSSAAAAARGPLASQRETKEGNASQNDWATAEYLSAILGNSAPGSIQGAFASTSFSQQQKHQQHHHQLPVSTTNIRSVPLASSSEEDSSFPLEFDCSIRTNTVPSVDYSTFLTPSMDAVLNLDASSVLTSSDLLASLATSQSDGGRMDAMLTTASRDHAITSKLYNSSSVLNAIPEDRANDIDETNNNAKNDNNEVIGNDDIISNNNEKKKKTQNTTQSVGKSIPTTIPAKPTTSSTTNRTNVEEILELSRKHKEKYELERKQAAPKKKKQQKPRGRIRDPDVKHYVLPQPNDVLLGRGGRSNHHSGNIQYRDQVGTLREWYRSSEKNAKTDLSQLLVDWVQKEQRGRFLKLDESNQQWYIVTNVVARRKASQALREHMTMEERKLAKQEKKSNRQEGENDDSKLILN